MRYKMLQAITIRKRDWTQILELLIPKLFSQKLGYAVMRCCKVL